MGKVILILSDGLRYDTAVTCMGYLGHLVETKTASLFKIMGELPSCSRPVYETLHTGLPASAHGVVANSVVRLSEKPNLFRLASQAGKVTAAVSYYWFSELYNRAPYRFVEDKETDDPGLPIQHGRFYTDLHFPDAEVFLTSAWMVQRWNPDYLLIHPMGMDTVGETCGPDSRQYRGQAIQQDLLLAPLIDQWRSLGYHILVTADHGINPDGMHGGTTDAEREAPLYLILADQKGAGATGLTFSQLAITPTLCSLLGLPVQPGMAGEIPSIHNSAAEK